MIEQEIHSASFSSIFDEDSYAESLHIDPRDHKALFVFTFSGGQPTDEKINYMITRSTDLTIFLAQYMNLYRFLDEERLVFLYKPACSDGQSLCIGKAYMSQPSKNLIIPLYDDGLRDLALKYHHSFPISSLTLKELVSNDFVDDEVLRFIKSLRASWVAIWFSMVLGLFA